MLLKGCDGMESLDRFLKAQEEDYETALSEIRSGHKRSHWIWYIFPQLKGLGFSSTSEYYGINGLSEAKSYMENEILRARLIEISEALRCSRECSISSLAGKKTRGRWN
jgi:uncharacterized protein (DUF1810 family)